MTFDELGVMPNLTAALLRQQISTPTPIQARSIPEVLKGDDVYISSETGSGKTLAYLLPLFCRLDAGNNMTQFLIIVPTHELALQINDQAKRLIEYSNSAIRSQVMVGNVATRRQLEKLKKKPQLIIGSPGRILDFILMRKLKVHKVAGIVVDEADCLLHGETLEPTRRIIRATLKERQLIFVSATEQAQSAKIADSLSPALSRVFIGSNQVCATIEHVVIACEDREKPDVLRKLVQALTCERIIVFVHRSETAEIVSSKLAHHGISADNFHAGHGKSIRKQVMDSFRTGNIQVLVASDAVSRGIDIKGVSHIINFDMPSQSKAYLHRAGRTGRVGEKGHVISLAGPQELRLVKRYEQELDIIIPHVQIHRGSLIAVTANGN